MPVLSGSISYTRYELVEEAPPTHKLKDALVEAAFKPLPDTGETDRSSGFVELSDPDATAFEGADLVFDGWLCVRFRTDTIRVPAALLKQKLEAWAKAYEAEHDRPPPKGQKKEQKELLLKSLRRQAFPISRTVDLSWKLETGEIWIWTHSPKQNDEITAAFEDAFRLHLRRLGPQHLAEESVGEKAARLSPTPELFLLTAGSLRSRSQA